MPEYVRENVWHKRLKIAVGQIDPTIGDFPGNIEKILAAVHEAQRLSCNLVVFPEMSLTGGPAHDLLLRPDFVKSQIAALKELVGRIGKIVALVGFVDRRAEGREVKLFNSAALIFDGSVRRVIDKTQMSELDGFDERRYLTPGEPSAPLKLNGVPLGILIGDDVQRPDACKRLVKEGASLIIGLMSLSFRMGDFATRLSEMADVARNADVDVLVANMVGGQDELVFDGGSFAVDSTGRTIWRAPQLKEGLFVAEIPQTTQASPALSDIEQVRQSLKLAVHDFVHKSGLSKAIIGLSGGIDSALVATLAAEALGPENVMGLIMPSEISSPESTEDAQKLASNIGIKTKVIPIGQVFETYIGALSGHFDGKEPDTTEENLQARIRGAIMMALANKLGYMVLSTGNRSESLVGYATLYGDMAGGFAPISDVPKMLVYELAKHINSEAGQELIPRSIIEKEPSAELRPDQTDAQALGPYKSLDAILEAYIDSGKTFEQALESGHDEESLRNALSRLLRSEFKRYQAPPGPRIVSGTTTRQRNAVLAKSIESWFGRKLWET